MTNRFDRQLWAKFWAIAHLYWFRDQKWQARGFLLLLVILLLAFTTMNVVINFSFGSFMTALSEKKEANFYRQAWILLGVLVVAAPVSAFYGYVTDKLGINWREWLTQHFLQQYFANRAYYEINNDKEIDNPDQRIAQDVNSFTVTSLRFFAIIFFSISQLIAFMGVLWSISRPLTGVLVVYATIGTIITLGFGKKLVFLNFEQLRREADFRYGLVHIRDNAEAIAFYGGEQQESEQATRRFLSAVQNFNLLILWQRNLSFFTSTYANLIQLVPFVVVAQLFFTNQIAFGVISQGASAFRQVLDAVSIVVNRFEDLTAFTAAIERLHSFTAALQLPEASVDLERPTIDRRHGTPLALSHVTVQTPNYRRTLVRDLSLELQPWETLVIVGHSGIGKSSLLRVMAGLWNAGTGKVVQPDLSKMLFLPQRPYMTLGTLRQQLLYPQQDKDVSETQLRAVLADVNLADLPDRLGGFDIELEWKDILSLGEQQRLAFARLLLARPSYAILDEATSALDVQNEALLYQKLQEMEIAYISVGHRTSLLKYHQKVLELQSRQCWQLVEVSDYNPNSEAFA